jgi:hypothetical protein
MTADQRRGAHIFVAAIIIGRSHCIPCEDGGSGSRQEPHHALRPRGRSGPVGVNTLVT